jgi:hypothetical protein
MAEIGAALFILFLVALMGLHIFTLPANWAMLAFLAVWKVLYPADFVWTTFLIWVLLAGIAEIIEFVAGIYGAKKYGATGRGNWGGIIGTIAGAIIGAPFFLGIGALIGAFLGAYLGCLLVERMHDRPWPEAKRAAWGAMLGRFIGTTVKVAVGVMIIFLAAPKIWP